MTLDTTYAEDISEAILNAIDDGEFEPDQLIAGLVDAITQIARRERNTEDLLAAAGDYLCDA